MFLILCYSAKHKFGKCPKNIEVHNMFRTKLVNFNATITPKPLKINNVLVNVVVDVTTRSQQPKHVFKEREPVKAKGAKDWQQEKCLWDSFIEIVRQLQHGGTNKQPTIINEDSLQSNWARLLYNSTTTQLVENNQTGDANQLVISEQVRIEKKFK
jgi:hypothetical protein